MTAFRAEFVGNPQRVEQYKNSAYAEHATTQSKKSPYTISTFMQAKAVANRRYLIIKGALGKQVVSTVIFIIQAIIVGTVFLKSPQTTAAYFSRGGVIFLYVSFIYSQGVYPRLMLALSFSALLFAALSSMAEIPALFAQRPIVIKHYKAAMYHPFIEAAGMSLKVERRHKADTKEIRSTDTCGHPYHFLHSRVLQHHPLLPGRPSTYSRSIFVSSFYSVFACLLYFAHMLIFLLSTFFLYIITMSLTMKAWFRAVAAGFGDPAPAQSVAGILLLALTLYTGYAIPKPTMIGALRWITYINVSLKFNHRGQMVAKY